MCVCVFISVLSVSRANNEPVTVSCVCLPVCLSVCFSVLTNTSQIPTHNNTHCEPPCPVFKLHITSHRRIPRLTAVFCFCFPLLTLPNDTKQSTSRPILFQQLVSGLHFRGSFSRMNCAVSVIDQSFTASRLSGKGSCCVCCKGKVQHCICCQGKVQHCICCQGKVQHCICCQGKDVQHCICCQGKNVQHCVCCQGKDVQHCICCQGKDVRHCICCQGKLLRLTLARMDGDVVDGNVTFTSPGQPCLEDYLNKKGKNLVRLTKFFDQQGASES